MIPSLVLLRVVPVLLLLIGIALWLRRVIVRWAYESKPRVWRAEWRSLDGIGLAEIQRLGRLQALAEFDSTCANFGVGNDGVLISSDNSAPERGGADVAQAARRPLSLRRLA